MEPTDAVFEEIDIASGADEIAPAKLKGIEIAGDAFDGPQRMGVIFALVIKGHQFFGAKSFDVIGVEVLVTEQPKDVGVLFAQFAVVIGVGIVEIFGSEDIDTAVAMLQSAPLAAHGVI